MTTRAAIRQADVTRLIKALEAAGKQVHRVEFDGAKVSIITSDDPAGRLEPNEWDDL